MLFRNAEGKLVVLNRYDYKNDHIYYKKVLQIKQLIVNTPKETNYSKVLIQNATASTSFI
jgi:hypothetical protein